MLPRTTDTEFGKVRHLCICLMLLIDFDVRGSVHHSIIEVNGPHSIS